MKPSRVRIERFLEHMEARLAPPPDRTRFLRLMADPGPGETAESAISKYLEEHPEDRERADWLAWLWTGVPRFDKPNGDSSVENDRYRSEAAPEKTAVTAPEKTAAPPAAVANARDASLAAAPAPEPKKPNPVEPEPEPITPWGFGPRRMYDPTNDTW
jgi:hypothetical protein